MLWVLVGAWCSYVYWVVSSSNSGQEMLWIGRVWSQKFQLRCLCQIFDLGDKMPAISFTEKFVDSVSFITLSILHSCRDVSSKSWESIYQAYKQLELPGNTTVNQPEA